MQSVDSSAIKVVWLCPYPVDKFLSDSYFVRKRKYHPAPWLVNTINVLKDVPEIDLYVVTLNAHIKRDTIYKYNGVTFFVLKRGFKPFSIGYPKQLRLDLFTLFFKESRDIKKVLKEIDPDLVHSFGSEVPYGIASVRSGYQVVFSLQGLMLKMSELFPANLNFKIMGAIEKRIIKKCNFFISQSASVSTHIKSINEHAIIYNTFYPVDDCFFEISQDVEKSFDLVFVGNILDRNKGFNILIESLIQLSMIGIKLKLAVIGSSENDQKLIQGNLIISNREIVDSISFLGYLSHKDIAEVYSKSRILVVPSLMESYSMTAAEGLASKICVIASRTGGLMDLIQHSINGLLFISGDPIDLADKIKELLADNQLQKTLSTKGRLVATERFSKASVAHSHLSAYNSIILNLNLYK